MSRKNMGRISWWWIVGVSLIVSGCGAADRLSSIGAPPVMTPVSDPRNNDITQTVTLPMPPQDLRPEGMNSSSLWPGGDRRGFFQDQRARKIGDILTVEIDIRDQASLSNKSERSRGGSESAGIDGLFGIESALTKISEDIDPSAAVGMNSKSSSSGSGTVKRNETILLKVAAIVTQVLPNGSLVISGRQEVRVNFELRELKIAGIIRPQDISPTNTIGYQHIAEARISYGGRGQITDVQQPRYGQQVLDILLPW